MALRMRLARVVALLLVLAAAGCSGKESAPPSPPPDELEATPFPTTIMLSGADLAGIEALPDGKLVFAAPPASMRDIAVGRVIVAGQSPRTPLGLLRIVTKVARDGDAVMLDTANAPIQLAFRKLHARIRRTTPALGAPEWTRGSIPGQLRSPLGFDATASLPLDFLLYDADNDPTTANDQVSINGELGGGFVFDLSIDVDWGEVFDLPAAVTSCLDSLIDIASGELPSCELIDLMPEVKVKFAVDPVMQARIAMVGSASLSYDDDFDIATLSLTPIPLGPLVFFPSVDVIARVEGGAAAGFAIGASGAAQFSTSVSVSNKPSGFEIVPFELKRAEFDADDTQVTLSAYAKVGVGARLNVQLYGVFGPSAAARVYAEVSGDIERNPCWELMLGLEGELGIRVNSPKLSFLGSVTLLDWKSPPFKAFREQIASGNCLPIPQGPQLPPGSGPDATSLSAPGFEPWIASFEDAADDGVVRVPFGNGREWAELSLAIDGRYVAAGSRNDKLVKFSDDGEFVWSRRYLTETTSAPLRLQRVAHAKDATMLVVAMEGPKPSLLKVAQSGDVIFRKTIEFNPVGGCEVFEPTNLVRDGGAGFFLVGGCLNDERAAIVHLDADASVLDIRTIRDASGARSLHPTAAVAVGADAVVVLGTVHSPEEGTTMFAARLGPGEGVAFSTRYTNCESPSTIAPLSARVESDGQVVVAGSSGTSRTGMLARLRTDGSVAFAGFQKYDDPSYFFLTSFAELPTTGFVATASILDTSGESYVPGLALVSLDAAGRPLWAKRYSQPGGRAATTGSVLLTNDGGAVINAWSERPAADAKGGLWSLKVFAKNGSTEGAAGATVEDMGVLDFPCAMAATDWPITVGTAQADLVQADTTVVTAR
ncbi:MAG: hypothetical protein WBV82_16865 [Myxococcaceae bacterium]